MNIPRIALAIALLSLGTMPHRGAAQDLSALVASGRFDEAVELLRAAPPEQAEAGARLMFEQAYSLGFQARRYDYAIDGFRAARRVPGISEGMGAELDFFHGLSVMQVAAALAEAQDLATAREALPMFVEAQALLDASGDYGGTAGANVASVRQALETYIAIQQAIIRRGY
jgi:hypothetical protein